MLVPSPTAGLEFVVQQVEPLELQALSDQRAPCQIHVLTKRMVVERSR